MAAEQEYTLFFEEIGSGETARVGGKNSSLGEMIRNLEQAGIRVPTGFATTARLYRDFLGIDNLRDRMAEQLESFRRGEQPLEKTGRNIRELIMATRFTEPMARAIREAYRELAARGQQEQPAVAVRSSATAEDLPEASFAGQQETYLNITGPENLLEACRRCFASLFTDRAIIYRENHGFEHLQVALSVGVQFMVRSDLGGAGVMFSIDTETGFPDAVLINANWGLGETVVQGTVEPDEYMAYKPLLKEQRLAPVIKKVLGSKERKLVYADRGGQTTRIRRTSREEQNGFVLQDREILQLARWAVAIEDHYGKPMDIEWARDGETGKLFIVQARPETVQSRRQTGTLKTFQLKEKGRQLAKGVSIGDAIATGKVIVLKSAREIGKFEEGAVLATRMTDPDWVPIMKKAAAIVTDYGGRTSHAAIVSRELGLPAVVGTGNVTSSLKNGQEVTVSCAEGDAGFVYEGKAEYEVKDVSLAEIPSTRTKVMLNMANPGAALRWASLPSDGVGLARMEFIINNMIKVHPMALLRFDGLKDKVARHRIRKLTRGYEDRTRYFIDRLAYGIAMIAASQHPKPVIVRMSDFKTNEYAELLGGREFEPQEHNPMLGWRGANRYYSEGYREGFGLECAAIRKVREEIGFTNVVVMIPFCRTPEEADQVLEVMGENGLTRGENGLEVYVMCEVPSNVILAEEFAARFDGFSIGSNDLTQLVLGVDRDSETLAAIFSEDSEAVKRMIAQVIETAHAKQRQVGLCGQAPSDRPAFGRFLVQAGIDSMSVSPDSFLAVKQQVAAAEQEGAGGETAAEQAAEPAPTEREPALSHEE